METVTVVVTKPINLTNIATVYVEDESLVLFVFTWHRNITHSVNVGQTVSWATLTDSD